jgi:hypothetical protein
MVPVSVSVAPVSLLLLPCLIAGLDVIFPSSCHQHLPLHRITHHGLVCGLLLLLDRQHRVAGNLGSRVAQGVCILVQGHETLLTGILFQRLGFVALHQAVQSALSQQIALHLLRHTARARPSRSRAIIHPIHTIHTFSPTSGFLKTLEILDLALFGALLEHLISFLALLQRF